MSALDSLDYAYCFDAMRRCGLTFSPSEAHAIAVGMLAGEVRDREQQWSDVMYADLDPDDGLAQECRTCLGELYRMTVEQMQDMDFGLQLFTPPETIENYTAAAALRDWAQGFLYGFGLAGDTQAKQLSPEGQEALHDLYQIGNMDVPEGGLDEDEQQALVEVEEYIRVAAMLIYEDVHVPQQTNEAPHEIH